MIGKTGKRGNSARNWKHGNRCAGRTIGKKLLIINERKSTKTPDYCIIYFFGERCDNRILSIKRKEHKKAEIPINLEKGKDMRANRTCLAARASEKAGKKKDGKNRARERECEMERKL